MLSHNMDEGGEREGRGGEGRGRERERKRKREGEKRECASCVSVFCHM